MNYRHIFHAGNFADVFKHWILTLLLQKLAEKPTPFFVLDTHAGIGFYDLNTEEAQKSLEQASGIQRLLDKRVDVAFKPYMRIFRGFNAQGQTHIYPGSPFICLDFLRANDRMVLSELHPEDFISLQNNFTNDKRVQVLKQDGYTSIKALLPPAEKRGLIFIDPPFEQENEFEHLCAAVEAGIKRFAHGMFAIWYPIKDRKPVQKFYRSISKLPADKVLVVELHANQVTLNQLNSCGMLIVNPPWQLDNVLRANMPKLLSYLDFVHGTYVVSWLKSEQSKKTQDNEVD